MKTNAPGTKANNRGLREIDAPALYEELFRVRDTIARKGKALHQGWQAQLRGRRFRISALNLAHYLILRQLDLRSVQRNLMRLGLSSLGRSEAHVMSNLDTVLSTLEILAGNSSGANPRRPRARTFFRGERFLQKHTKEVFGPSQHRRRVRLMVTLPYEAAADYPLVRELIKSGMDVARINCAHDSSQEWQRMIAHIRQAEAETGRRCKIEMDLCGPRARVTEVKFTDSPRRLTKGEAILMVGETMVACSDVTAVMSTSIPDILPQLDVGKHVYVNDGKLGTIVEKRMKGGLLLRVVIARDKGEELAVEKNLNFPDTALKIKPLTEKDLADLDFVSKNADLVGYSFVQDPGDIELLQRELVKRGRAVETIGLVAKIETRRAVDNLPGLIIQGAGQQPFAVMIARGDLAVEVGWENLAEIQEEILWLCEAAHVPVIWATQVLERLVKKGLPTRTEITDAAMSERAECVMLNKGPYLCEALKILNEVLKRMQIHQCKKTPQMNVLPWSYWVDAAIEEDHRRGTLDTKTRLKPGQVPGITCPTRAEIC